MWNPLNIWKYQGWDKENPWLAFRLLFLIALVFWLMGNTIGINGNNFRERKSTGMLQLPKHFILQNRWTLISLKQKNLNKGRQSKDINQITHYKIQGPSLCSSKGQRRQGEPLEYTGDKELPILLLLTSQNIFCPNSPDTPSICFGDYEPNS